MKKSIPLLFLFVLSFLFSDAQIWIKDLDQAKAIAQTNDKLIIIDFYADWCGPCKKMDIETWSKNEVIEQMQKLVTAKIDIDLNKMLASQYGVKSIPTTIITDSWGNVLHKEIGLKSASQITKLLKDIPENIKPLRLPLEKLNENPKNPENNFDLAMAYQKIAKTLSNKGKSIFVSESNSYLAKAGRHYKKTNNIELQERIELMKCYNKTLNDQSKSAIKDLNKMDFEDIKNCNKALAYFVLVNGYMELQDKKNAETYFKKIGSCENSSELVAELKQSYPELSDS